MFLILMTRHKNHSYKILVELHFFYERVHLFEGYSRTVILTKAHSVIVVVGLPLAKGINMKIKTKNRKLRLTKISRSLELTNLFP